jgi:site-specific DNA recombinase
MSGNHVRAGIYARISDDREGEEAGVKRQLDDGRKLVQARGGAIVMEKSDNDISALKGKKRPGYDAIMAAAKAGEITHIIVWHTSRLWRNRRERADGIEILRRAEVSVLAVKGPELDMTTAYGRGMAGLIGEFDTMESEVKSERIKRKVEELAAEGKIANGGPRPFGFHRVYEGEGPRRKILRDELHPDEAPIVREAARRVLAGESMRSVTADLNERGVRSSSGIFWTQRALRTMLRSGRIAGLREHNREVIGKAVWPAIIAEEEHKLLRAKLDSQGTWGTKARVHYLTGWVLCDDCGVRGIKMGVLTQRGQYRYRCMPKHEGGCNGRTILMDPLVDLVDAYMIGRLSDKKTLKRLTAQRAPKDDRTADILARIESHERRLQLLQQSMEEGDEDEIPEVAATVRVVRRKLTEAREELGQVTAAPDIAALDFPALAKSWKSLHIDQKQMLLGLFVDRIIIGPGRRGYGRFDPDRVNIVPKRR